MKKLLLLLVVACAFTSCYIGTEGPRGPQGPPGKDGLVNYKIIDLQVNQNEWKYSGYENNNFFVASFAMPEITANIYNNGLVQVYREYNTGTPDARQILLPQTRHNEVLVNNTWVFYTETVDYEYGVGTLSIFYTASDFDYEINQTFVPEGMHFRAVLMW